MKHILILILIIVAVVGVLLWLGTQDTVEAPTAETPDTAEQSNPPATADYVGLSEVEAEALATQNGVAFRVVERDGEQLPTTRDFREGRINAVVSNGVVTSYTVESSESTPPATDPSTPTGTDTTGEPSDTDGTGASGEHDAIIGMTETEAEAYAEANAVPFRIGSVDGESLPVTMDYRPGRITATIESGVVTEYSVE